MLNLAELLKIVPGGHNLLLEQKEKRHPIAEMPLYFAFKSP